MFKEKRNKGFISALVIALIFLVLAGLMGFLGSNTQSFSKSNLIHCLLTVDFKTLFSSPKITS